MAVFRKYVAALRQPNLRSRLQLLRDLQTGLRLQFLYFAIDAGLLRALPANRDELVERLHVQRPDILDAALAMAVALKELSLRDGRYAVRGARSRLLLSADGDMIAGTIQEYVAYHSSVYRELTARLRGAPPGDYLERFGTVIARSSRVLEPFIAGFVKDTVKSGPVRLLEIGCGTGVYLHYAARANPQVTGVALDLQDSVIEQARTNLCQWGILDRFQLLAGDVRHPPEAATGPFDLITLHNNVYYFEPEERPALFGRLRASLAPGGTLLLTTLMRGNTVASLDFDLVLRCTAGCTPLPSLDDVTAQLKEGGFSDVRATRLMPLEPLYGLTAR